MPSNALDRALNGERVKGPAAERGLKDAASKIDRMTNAAKRVKANSKTTITQVVHATEVVGAGAVSSWFAGYRGRDRMKVRALGGADIRTVGGVGLGLLGLGRSLWGKKDGGHLLALGAGVAGSRLNEAAEEMGQKWATPAATAADADGKPAEVTSGDLREITGDDVDLGLTPKSSSDTGRLVKLRSIR